MLLRLVNLFGYLSVLLRAGTLVFQSLLLGGINFLLLRKNSTSDITSRLRHLLEAEVGIGITIILTAASLTSQPPAVDLANDTVDFARIASRLKPTGRGLWVRDSRNYLPPYPGRTSTSPARVPCRLLTPLMGHRCPAAKWLTSSGRNTTITGWACSSWPWACLHCWPERATRSGPNTGRCC